MCQYWQVAVVARQTAEKVAAGQQQDGPRRSLGVVDSELDRALRTEQENADEMLQVMLRRLPALHSSVIEDVLHQVEIREGSNQTAA